MKTNMPEVPDNYIDQDAERILVLKCARCFKDMKHKTTIFCSKECAEKGVLYPQAWGSNFSDVADKVERRRLQVLASYHRNKAMTRKVVGMGRPRKDGTNLNLELYPTSQ